MYHICSFSGKNIKSKENNTFNHSDNNNNKNDSSELKRKKNKDTEMGNIPTKLFNTKPKQLQLMKL